jgi:hypothetical protein
LGAFCGVGIIAEVHPDPDFLRLVPDNPVLLPDE